MLRRPFTTSSRRERVGGSWTIGRTLPLTFAADASKPSLDLFLWNQWRSCRPPFRETPAAGSAIVLRSISDSTRLMSTEDIELSSKTRESLDKHNLRPLWEIAENDLGQTRENLEADVWKWEDIRAAVDRIAEDVPSDVSPRVTVPVNASYNVALSHTISVGIETAPPGDTTPAHRHSGHFLRFAIDGHPGMKTAVGGEEFPMLDNDLVTIPQWEWHGHVNESDEETTWLVIDDSPLRMDTLKAGNLFEWYDDDRQAITRPRGYYESQYGNCSPPMPTNDVPGPLEGTCDPTPPYRFAWDDMSESIDYAEDNEDARSPTDGVVVTYSNPARGSGPLFPTIGVRAHRLLDGADTKAHSHNATEVYYVIEGSGQTIVNGDPLDWSDHDLFVVPSYEAHSHNPDSEATLLTMTDRPLLEAINLYHEYDQDPLANKDD